MKMLWEISVKITVRGSTETLLAIPAIISGRLQSDAKFFIMVSVYKTACGNGQEMIIFVT